VRLKTRSLLLLSGLGLGLLLLILWAGQFSAAPPWPVLLADAIAVVGLLVGPWLVLAGRQLLRARDRDPAASTVFSRALVAAAIIAGMGLAASVLLGAFTTTEPPLIAAGVAMISILAAGVVALLGGVLFPWLFVLTRTLTRERAARARAEERAEMSAHLHDSVLQALTLIQKQADDPRTVRHLARVTERGLRDWLFSGAAKPTTMDFTSAVRAAAQEVEDRFDVEVELVTVGTCPLDPRSRALLGAVGEALTNSARHAGVRRISLFTEIGDAELLAVVRDRGRGFTPDVPAAPDRHGIADSILGRVRQQGGTATVRSTVGEGTEVELRIPVSAWHD
jgi:signal transduction histidine kinase